MSVFSARGLLKWPDARTYTGTFKNGLEDGSVGPRKPGREGISAVGVTFALSV